MFIVVFCIHFLSVVSLLLIIISSIMMISKYDRTDWDRKIWIGSKILTLKKIIPINNNQIYPIVDIHFNGTLVYYKENYESLLKTSYKNCEEKNYKKCGILGTLGNIMCIPETDECPINDLVIDESSKMDEYINKSYKVGYLNDIAQNYYIYYRNNQTDNQIIAKIKASNETPKYIDEDNLVFDEDTFQDYYTPPDDDNDDWDYWDPNWDHDYDSYRRVNQSNSLRKIDEQRIFGDDIINSYIRNRFNDKINIDKTFRKISGNIYAGNYIGFNSSTNLNDYNNFELYDLYFIIFPNKASYVFCFICAILYFLVIVIYISIIYHEPNDMIGFPGLVFLPYLIFFIGFFSYILYEYSNIYKSRRPFDLTKVKADSFLEDLLKEIQGRHCEENLILAIIILYSCSMFLLILSLSCSCFAAKNDSSILESTSNTKSEQNANLL